MYKNAIIKCLTFLVVLVSIVAIICVLNQNSNKKEINYFITKDNVKDERPDYPIAITSNMSHNRGINIMGSALNSNDGSYIVIEQGDSIALYGWAINTEENQPVDDIYMEINNKYVKGIYGLPMPEIQKKFKIKSSSEIGFLFYFDRSLLKDENGQYCNKLRFHLMNHEKETISSMVEYQLIYKNNKLKNLFRDIISTDWNKGLNLEYIDNGILDKENKTISIEKGEIHINGWIVDIDNRKPCKNLHIAIGNNTFTPSYFSEREDVAAILGMSETNNIGFKFIIHEKFLLNGDGQLYDHIEFYLEDSNGVICQPIRYKLNRI